jgi:hypothetical protein
VSRAAAAVALALVAAAPSPAPAEAADVTRAELIALGEAAPSDPQALARLRSVTSVDGAPVDVEAALAGVTGAELDTRLEELALAASSPSEAPEVDLSAEPPPDVVVEEPPSETSEGIEIGVPLWLGATLALVALIAGAVLAQRLGRRRVVESERVAAAASPDDPVKPTDVEAAAEAAGERGDFAQAIRLWFQAGLARLDSLGAIRVRPSLTAPAAAREVGSGTLAELAGSYQRVVFGGAEAGRGDFEQARERWRSVIAEVERR